MHGSSLFTEIELKNTNIRNNDSHSGVLWFRENSRVRIIESIISNNHVRAQGGINFSGDSLLIFNSIIDIDTTTYGVSGENTEEYVLILMAL